MAIRSVCLRKKLEWHIGNLAVKKDLHFNSEVGKTGQQCKADDFGGGKFMDPRQECEYHRQMPAFHDQFELLSIGSVKQHFSPVGVGKHLKRRIGDPLEFATASTKT